MNASMQDSGSATAGPRSLLFWSSTPPVVFGAAVIVLAMYAIFYAPTMWRQVEQVKAKQIDQENRAVCEKFGMPHGSEGFAMCAGSLLEIRRRHADRLAAEAAGIF